MLAALLLAYRVTTAGGARNIPVVAATNQEAAARAVEICASIPYAPGRKAGTETAMDVVQCVTMEGWAAMFRVVN